MSRQEDAMRWADRILRTFQSPNRTHCRRPSLQILEERAVPAALLASEQIVRSLGQPVEAPPPTPKPPLPEVTGRLWRDLNANGLQDSREPGIPFVGLKLYQGDTVVGSTTTDYLGNYRFNLWNVNNGTASPDDDGIHYNTAYQVRVDGGQPALAGVKPTVADPGQTGANELSDSDFTAAPTGAVLNLNTTTVDHYTHLDGGYAQTGSIGDLVWLDSNNNGRKDPKEKGIAGVTVRLLDSTTQDEVATTTTGADGSYKFDGVLPGSYVVEIADTNFAAGGVLFGHASSTGKPGQITGLYEGAGLPDPNVARTNGLDHGFEDAGVVQSLAVNVGTHSGGSQAVDFGFFRSSDLSGRVFVDMNGNGQIDPEDTAGVENARVWAAGPAGMFGTFTDADGSYQFTNLPTGTYTITLPGQPEGYKRITPSIVTTNLPLGGTATVNFGEARTVDLRIKQSVSSPIVGVGGTVVLTYRITNLGTQDATGVALNATLPASFKIVSVDDGGTNYNPDTQSATIGTLAAGDEVVIKVRARVAHGGSYRLRATAIGNESEDNLANNHATVRVSTPAAFVSGIISSLGNWFLGSSHR